MRVAVSKEKMYIAFKWLVFLALTMWVAMCLIDTSVEESINILNMDTVFKSKKYINQSVKIQLPVTDDNTKETLHPFINRDDNTANLHFLMFIVGALAVTAFHKKRVLVTFAHRKVPTINKVILTLFRYLKVDGIISRDAIVQYTLNIRETIKIALSKIRNKISNLKKSNVVKHTKIHIILLKKMKEMAEERKSLGQLLISAIHENKNIRMRYELETMTKNRLMQHMEDTQKQVKESRSRYVSFQQLYLLTHQENVYLRARIVKLKQEKEKCEKDLMGLINQVYLSKNKDLKTYCTRFLVKTKDNLLNSDVGAEIKEFLENSRKTSEISLTEKIKVNNSKIPSCTRIQITEIVNEEDCLDFITSEAPVLRGLPGEHVWTLTDKEGIVEKLYDYESDFDRGDTIRRIRQYSVYFDKDCLLDFGRTQREANAASCSNRLKSNGLQHSLGSQKIVTSSKAFQNFLKASTSNVRIKSTA